MQDEARAFSLAVAKTGNRIAGSDRDNRDHYQQFNQSEADTKANLKVASPN
jgi:hypothetical protein